MTDGMMNDTDVEVDLLESLEFDPTCELWYDHRVRLFGRWSIRYTRRKDCTRPAKWVGNVPCCATNVLACDPCRAHGSPLDLYECCGKRFFARMITWRKI